MAPQLRQRKWPRQLFDYAERRIVDLEAAEIDVEGGAWVRCAICPRTTVKMGSFFTIASWRKHQRTLQHRRAACEERGRAKSSPSANRRDPRRSSTLSGSVRNVANNDATGEMILSMRSDAEFLALCYKGLHSKEREREKFEANVHTVVNVMTGMLTEQQEEIDELYYALQKNNNDLESIRADVRALRRRLGQDSGLVHSDKRQPPLGSKRKSMPDPFEWNDNDGNGDNTRRMLHMSQYT